MACLAPRAPNTIVRPRRGSGVVARPLNFTVRGQPVEACRHLLGRCSRDSWALLLGDYPGFWIRDGSNTYSRFCARRQEPRWSARSQTVVLRYRYRGHSARITPVCFPYRSHLPNEVAWRCALCWRVRIGARSCWDAGYLAIQLRPSAVHHRSRDWHDTSVCDITCSDVLSSQVDL